MGPRAVAAVTSTTTGCAYRPAVSSSRGSGRRAGSSSVPLVAVWGAKGGLKTFEFPGRGGEAQLSYFVAKAGTYYVMVVGCCSYPEDRFESGSGTGAQEGSEGPYRLSVKVTDTDHDFYAVDLAKGDVLGGTVGGEAARLSVFAPDGRRVFGSEFDASFLYPWDDAASRRWERHCGPRRCDDWPLHRRGDPWGRRLPCRAAGLPARRRAAARRQRPDHLPRLRRCTGEHRDLRWPRGCGCSHRCHGSCPGGV
jgi:hypothetical protein